MFGQKKEQVKPAATAPKVEPYDIRVMPPKFHKYLSARRGMGLLRFGLILLIVFVVLGGVAFGAYYFMSNLKPSLPLSVLQPISNGNTNLNQASQNINEANLNLTNENLNVNVNENLNVNLNANDNSNFNQNLNVNDNVNLNSNVNLAPNVTTGVNYLGSLDSDQDGLTDVEEDIYGTEKRKPDTDGDGYLDSEELLNLYNPKAAGGALLENSGLVNVYKNPSLNYEIFYPSSWLARPTDQSLKEVIFQSATSEYVQVLVEDNTDKLDLVRWYLQQSPGADLNSLEKKTNKNGGYQVLVSPDKLTDYLAVPQTPDKVYVITYNVGVLKEINFLATFSLMVNSFRYTAPVTAIVPTNSNTNTQ